jgi:hypothetical protein
MSKSYTIILGLILKSCLLVFALFPSLKSKSEPTAEKHQKLISYMCPRIPFYIYLWSGRLRFLKTVKIVVPYKQHVITNVAQHSVGRAASGNRKLIPVADFPLVSTTSSANFATDTAGVVDTGGK